MVHPSVGELLRTVEDSAAMLRFLTNAASNTSETLDPSALSGMSDACEQIEETTRAIRGAFASGRDGDHGQAPLIPTR